MSRITRCTVTPIAFRDPPLLNSAGVHEPWALRSIIEIETDRKAGAVTAVRVGGDSVMVSEGTINI